MNTIFDDLAAAQAAGYRTVKEMRAAGYVVRDSGPFEKRGMYAAREGIEIRTVIVYTNEISPDGGRGVWYFVFPPAE